MSVLQAYSECRIWQCLCDCSIDLDSSLFCHSVLLVIPGFKKPSQKGSLTPVKTLFLPPKTAKIKNFRATMGIERGPLTPLHGRMFHVLVKPVKVHTLLEETEGGWPNYGLNAVGKAEGFSRSAV